MFLPDGFLGGGGSAGWSVTIMPVRRRRSRAKLCRFSQKRELPHWTLCAPSPVSAGIRPVHFSSFFCTRFGGGLMHFSSIFRQRVRRGHVHFSATFCIGMFSRCLHFLRVFCTDPVRRRRQKSFVFCTGTWGDPSALFSTFLHRTLIDGVTFFYVFLSRFSRGGTARISDFLHHVGEHLPARAAAKNHPWIEQTVLGDTVAPIFPPSAARGFGPTRADEAGMGRSRSVPPGAAVPLGPSAPAFCRLGASGSFPPFAFSPSSPSPFFRAKAISRALVRFSRPYPVPPHHPRSRSRLLARFLSVFPFQVAASVSLHPQAGDPIRESN